MKNLNEKMVNDKNVRDENLSKLVEGMKNDALVRSDIWNLGEDSEFKYIEGKHDYYMTVDMVASLFDCPKSSVENFTQEKFNKDYYNELLDAGMIQVKPFKIADSYDKQAQELKLKIVKASVCNDSMKPVGNGFHEIIGNTIVVKNIESATYVKPNYKVKLSGIDDELIIKANGMWLFSLRAVIKLGMFMTGTEKARLFRDKIIDQLALGQTAQETADEYFEALFDKENIKLYANDTEKLSAIHKIELQNFIIQ